MNDNDRIVEKVTLTQASTLVANLAHRQSILLLSPPGVGKSEIVNAAAKRAGLACRSLLGTQIAPEDVSGIPQIVGERSVFCPSRVLLPETSEPFCLFLDELPACTPDIQKAFYSLLLERRVGEYPLPEGTWVVAAGNRVEDRALVRTISSALLNRVLILQIEVDHREWLDWSLEHGIRDEIRSFIREHPDALLRPVPRTAEPFSTPRAWSSLSRILDLTSSNADRDESQLRALVAGRVSAEDVEPFCRWCESKQMLHVPVTRLGLSMRATVRLQMEGFPTIGQLISTTADQLKSLQDFDDIRVSEVQSALSERGLALRNRKIPVDGTRVESSEPRTVTLNQAKRIISSMSHEQSVLLLSSPGIGKSDLIQQAASEANLPCRSLLGTQIAPEDVSGIPRIIGERSVFCPPRVLLPESPEPFCLFLDELPAATPDIQKAFYSLLLERRIGENRLPAGTWVVAAGNRTEDRALVRMLSTALVNRVLILHVRIDVKEWLIWAKANGVRSEILSFITFMPHALMRDVPGEPVPFSTPRSWVNLSRSLDLVPSATSTMRRALAFGAISAEDAAVFCAVSEEGFGKLASPQDYIDNKFPLPYSKTACWFLVNRFRAFADAGKLEGVAPNKINSFLHRLPEELRFALLVDMVPTWARLGATETMFESLQQVTGLCA